MAIRKRDSKKTKNGYVFEVYITFKDSAGKRKRITKSGFLTKKEAQAYEAEQLKLLDNQINIKTKKYTLNEMFDLYIKNDPFTRESTKYNRASVYNKHVRNSVGSCDIKKLDYEYIQNFLNKLAKNNSKHVVENVYKALNGTFNHAYNNGYLLRVPYSKLKLNGIVPKKKAQTITLEEFNAIIENYSNPREDRIIETDNYIVALYIGLYTGVRIGECCALERKDVDLVNRKLNIDKQFKKEGKDYVISETKTESSNRVLPIAKELVDILTKHFQKYPECEYVVFDKTMQRMKPQTLRKSLDRACEKLDIDFHYHMLRHMFITQLYNKGVDIKMTQLLAGHAHYQTTADIYTELDESKTSEFETTNLYN